METMPMLQLVFLSCEWHTSSVHTVMCLLLQVTIRILDVNDNNPELRLPDLFFTIAENTSEPLYVTTAIATDDDISMGLTQSDFN